jgi:hypothetical protein
MSISPQRLRFLFRLSLSAAVGVAAVLFTMVWIFFSGWVFAVAIMLIPVFALIVLTVVWKLVLPTNAHGHIERK